MTFAVVFFGLCLALAMLMANTAEGSGLGRIKVKTSGSDDDNKSDKHGGSHTTGSFRRRARDLDLDVPSVTSKLGKAALGASSETPKEDTTSFSRHLDKRSMLAIKAEVETPYTPLSDTAINYFIKFANFVQQKESKDKKTFTLLDTSITKLPEPCVDHSKRNEDDVQILYAGASGAAGGDGHYICVHFVHQHRKVYVYDSLGMPVNKKQDRVLRVLYPRSEITLAEPRTKNNDITSCGVFAMAYATTIILGGDPRTYDLKLSTEKDVDPSMPLRRHLRRMFKEKAFSMFPNADGKSCTKSASQKNAILGIEEEIKTPYTVLSDDAMHYFIEFANLAQKKFPGNMKKYKLLDISVTMLPQHCENHQKLDEDDVQILYGGAGGDKGGEDIIGHYICVHHVHQDRKVYIYDSLRMKLNEAQRKVLRVLYPRAQITYAEPRTKQNDSTSCGVFSMAYATTIILGNDPRTYKFQLSTEREVDPSMPLRNHLCRMFKEKTLSMFP